MLPKRVIYILVDGLSASLLQNLIDKDQMPHIERYLIDRGFYTRNCLSCFPANTAPANLSHLTGSYVNRHGIPLIKYWIPEKGRYMDFTKSSLSAVEDFNNSISNNVKTIYEYFSGRTTALHFINRGANDIYAGKLKSIFLYLYAKIFGWDGLHRWAMKVALKRLAIKYVPRVIVIYLPGPDAISHELGPNSSEYIENVRNLDDQIRFLVEGDSRIRGLKDLKILNNTLIVFSSDHGEIEVKKTCPIDEHFRRLDINVLTGASTPKKIAGADVLMAISGGVAFLNFKDRKNGLWMTNRNTLQNFISKKETFDILEWLREIEGVNRIYLRESPNTYSIFTKEGESKISRKTKGETWYYKYEIVKGKDPFSYDKHSVTESMIGGKFFTSQNWQNATCNAEALDIVDQIPRIFDCESIASPVIVSSSNNCSFKVKHKGEHDNENKSIRQVPLIIAGENIKIESVNLVRTVDILPTVLDLLSVDYNHREIDGSSLVT